jgi:hypothetical protein
MGGPVQHHARDVIATINTAIALISLLRVFTGMRLDPLQPSKVSYLLLMLIGDELITGCRRWPPTIASATRLAWVS